MTPEQIKEANDLLCNLKSVEAQLAFVRTLRGSKDVVLCRRNISRGYYDPEFILLESNIDPEPFIQAREYQYQGVINSIKGRLLELGVRV